MIRDEIRLRWMVQVVLREDLQLARRGEKASARLFARRPADLGCARRARCVQTGRLGLANRVEFAFLATLPGTDPLRQCGVEPLALVLVQDRLGSRAASNATSAGGSTGPVLTVPPKRLAEILDAVAGVPANATEPDPVEVRLHCLLRQMHVRGLRGDPVTSANDLEKLLTESLAEVVGHQTYHARGATANYRRTARRADDWLRQRLGERLVVSELSRHCRCSRRYLEYAFDREFGLGPAAYLRTLRLDQARRILLARHHRPATVAEVAGQVGFDELGRFAGYYRKLFGESPRQTLSRAPIEPPSRLVLLT